MKLKDMIENSDAYVELVKYVEKGEYFDTFATVYCKEEDLENLKCALERQKKKELYIYLNGTEHCPNCEHDLSQRDSSDTHCPRCGQRFESQRVNKGV